MREELKTFAFSPDNLGSNKKEFDLSMYGVLYEEEGHDFIINPFPHT
jgi:hypothetical protein